MPVRDLFEEFEIGEKARDRFTGGCRTVVLSQQVGLTSDLSSVAIRMCRETFAPKVAHMTRRNGLLLLSL